MNTKTSRNYEKCENPECSGEYRVSLPDELAGSCTVYCNKCFDRKPEFYTCRNCGERCTQNEYFNYDKLCGFCDHP